MSLDVNDWRSVVTVLSLLMFLGLIAWTWGRQRKVGFDQAAQLPFLDSDVPADKAADQA